MLEQNRLSKEPSRKGNTHNLTKSVRELVIRYIACLAFFTKKPQFIQSKSRIKKNGLTA